jgi:cytidylate kinase
MRSFSRYSIPDKQDSGRDFAPLKKADDAIEIDTSEMGIDEFLTPC